MTKKQPTEKVKFVDDSAAPEVRDSRAQAWHDLFNQLREQPQRWAIVKDYDDERMAYSAYNRLRKYKSTLVPNGVWQLKSKTKRTNGMVSGSLLYARFMEEAETPEILKAIKGRTASSAYDNDSALAT
jgi:hypothetical protein